MQRIIVSDQPENWAFLKPYVDCISVSDYIQQADFQCKQPVRVFNLSSDYQYQKHGYYVSLLAEARSHKVFPTVMTIQDANNASIPKTAGELLHDEIQQDLKRIKSDTFDLSIYFGKNLSKQYDKLCRMFHGLFPFPLFIVKFIKNKKEHWKIAKILPLHYNDIPESHLPFLQEAATQYFKKRNMHTHRMKSYQFDLAILHNPNEKNPPSNQGALKLFVEAAEQEGFSTELIEKVDYKSLAEYDALFIRETTAVNHHTYQFSRKAAFEQLIAIDDPNSILKCSNKVYLQNLLEAKNILTPKSVIISKDNWRDACKQLDLPCVLKLPDSAFSKGVIKIETQDELVNGVKSYLKQSSLVIAQAFVPSEFDWRIGIFGNQLLYACQYYMAKDHWQIYNWQSTDEKEGYFETIPLADVPPLVTKTALKAAKLIGDGLFGVDLKEINGQVYVIEINDNPNIDHGIEDQVVGQALYLQIIREIKRRVMAQHGYS